MPTRTLFATTAVAPRRARSRSLHGARVRIACSQLTPAVAALEWGDGSEGSSLEGFLQEEEKEEEEQKEEEGHDSRRPPLVLCSDVVYEPMAYEPLVQTMTQLATAFGATRTVMAHRSRHPDEHLFFSSIATNFTMRLLSGPPFRPLNGAANSADEEQREGQEHGSAVRLLEFTYTDRK